MWEVLHNPSRNVVQVEAVSEFIHPPQLTRPDWLCPILSDGKSGKEQVDPFGKMISTEVVPSLFERPPDTIIPEGGD